MRALAMVFVLTITAGLKLTTDSVEQDNVTITSERGCGTRNSRCCYNYIRNEDGACVACPNGTFGRNCSLGCPVGYFGLFCLSLCNCTPKETCTSSDGCQCLGCNDTDSQSTKEWFPYMIIFPLAFLFLALSVLFGTCLLKRRNHCCKIPTDATEQVEEEQQAHEHMDMMPDAGGRNLTPVNNAGDVIEN